MKKTMGRIGKNRVALISSMMICNKSMSEYYRRIWTNEEDEAIRQMVLKYGTKSWALIAENLSKEHSIAGRSGKQCRERWHNHLGEY